MMKGGFIIWSTLSLRLYVCIFVCGLGGEGAGVLNVSGRVHRTRFPFSCTNGLTSTSKALLWVNTIFRCIWRVVMAKFGLHIVS